MCPGEPNEDDVKMYQEMGIQLERYPLTEEEYPLEERLTDQQTIDYWHRAHSNILEAHKQNHAVLVHCVAGVNRSVATIIYHLLLTSQSSYQDVMYKIRTLRPIVDVDRTFLNLLAKINIKRDDKDNNKDKKDNNKDNDNDKDKKDNNNKDSNNDKKDNNKDNENDQDKKNNNKDNEEKQVYTRFAPECNSMSFHIGHLLTMKFSFTHNPNSKCYLRFDDTNPETEKQIYVDGMLEDMKWLEYPVYKITYTSDYFDFLFQAALDLIKNDKAYVDFTPQNEISNMRRSGIESKYRSMNVEFHLLEFKRMRQGFYQEGEAQLRLKIDMNSLTHSLRDPTAYRIRYLPHFKTGTKWCIYPTYDYSHGIVDALENITYSYCTMEYFERREQYYWPLTELNKLNLGYALKPAAVVEYGKLTVKNNILSKRNINKLVESKIVSGYDDPRLLTIKGLKRRGYTPSILKNIVDNAVMSRTESEFTQSILEFNLRRELNDNCARMFAVIDPLKLCIETPFEPLNCSHPNHPKKEMGHHITRLESTIYIEKSDFKEADEKGYYRLAPGKIIRLRYGPFLEYVRHNDSQVVCRPVTVDSKTKIKGIIHWVSHKDSTECLFELYENLLDNDGQVNENSSRVARGRVENSVLMDLTTNYSKSYQFERLGYFKFDRYEDIDKKIPVFIRIIDLFDQYN